MSQKASKKMCPQGYFVNRVAEVIVKGPSMEELQEVALELVVSEVRLRSLLESGLGEAQEDILPLLDEIDRAKRMVYRAYMVLVLESRKSRVVKWR
ncbi:hypothetical protein IG193_07425 [Infirmifilum lucidum]|uniref:Uncharacterized protein n=1 Tax=Infirmifilum lucidum TaxID=2776706 RepID=A0A7L9FFR3_9CREN|nr:hypothetical protein [Infirmifilum lucidum]QOJ78579.1 hypothetical protein IG193_07425 [Infirmifilum lucidum]